VAFTPIKFNALFEEMRSRSTVVTDFEVGSVVRTMYESFAYEIALLYEKMNLVYLSAFVDTAEGQQLDKVVAVLGIKRGLPDFAEGTVTFARDVGKKDIAIPLGTLVATEDTEASPKKAYQTFEPGVIYQGSTAVEIKVRAVERGEDQVAAAETVVVMPRPLPGIKSVLNQEAIRFLGKRRETDDELRERAKNALISAGKATIFSIENALLSLPGVKDVRVHEGFHFARGAVTFQRASGTGDVSIPKGTGLTATVAGVDKPFATTDLRVLLDGDQEIAVPVESTLEGQVGQLDEIVGVTWSIESAELNTLTAGHDTPILLGDFGIIEVFVDGIDFGDPKAVQRLRQEIDRVRAAGIFVLLKSVIPVHVDAVLQVALDPNLNVSAEEVAGFEGAVGDTLNTMLANLKMGQSFVFSKLFKEILSVEGVDDLLDFQINTEKGGNGGTITNTFVLSDKRMETEAFERFNARYLCVAVGKKKLTVGVQFRADGLDAPTLVAVQAALQVYFGSLGLGDRVRRSEVVAALSGVGGITLDAPTLMLQPTSWCPRPLLLDDGGDTVVEVTFVEQPVLGDVFAYHSFLDITGTLALTLPSDLTTEAQDDIRDEIQTRLDTYLNSLPAEANVVYGDLIAAVTGVDRVLGIELDWEDVRVERGGTPFPERVTDKEIAVEAFEKARRTFVCITGGVETVTMTVTLVALEFLGVTPPVQVVVDEVKLAVQNSMNNFLVSAEPGFDLVYNDVKAALEGLVPGANYVVTALSLQALSQCDNRIQTTDIATARDLHVRSVELPVIQPISVNDINVTLPPP